VRSTTKYWVHTEHVSAVKLIVLQHLPVFLQESMQGETDAQLVNSVYLDNRSFELYRGRMDKTQGAIALRLRWYGTSVPKLVFVERKTHRESWMGEVSVKERFIISENQVHDLLSGRYDKGPELARMKTKGMKQQAIKEWEQLVDECAQAINSKQLEPTLRTQYMRTAFQIPFDATVRVSLDTNLCMINERTENVVSGERWYRDPTVEIPPNEITRFPHSVLEIKLQLDNVDATPPWVTELIESGMLLEVHKFSKFIHGCATLMTDEVQAVPYWIDDPTLAESIRVSGAAKLLDEVHVEPPGVRQSYDHVMVHDSQGNSKVPVVKRAPPPVRMYGSMDDKTLPPTIAGRPKDIPHAEELVRRSSLSDEPPCMPCFSSKWCEWREAEHLGMKSQKVYIFLADHSSVVLNLL
jgi:SPX domain protein involved in polyphosphate accumulation